MQPIVRLARHTRTVELTTMTMQQFLTITSSTPPPTLRQAMAAALAVEPAHRHNAFPRFYDRVLEELGLTDRTGSGLAPSSSSSSKTRRSELAA